MDTNGTRFQLLQGQADWLACEDAGVPGPWQDVAWNDATQSVTLLPLLRTLPPPRAGAPLDPSSRRGAAVDRYGHWYWIGADGASIWLLPRGERVVRQLWSQASAPDTPADAGFHAIDPPAAAPIALAGLVVTRHHYLVAGCASAQGLLIFDLESGARPTLLTMPAGDAFTPFDMAPAQDGGCWVLDRVNRRYWGFDRDFRALAHVPAASPPPVVFAPVDGSEPVRVAMPTPAGYPVAAADPVAIEALPDGSVLVLDAGAPVATVLHYRGGALLGPAQPLSGTAKVVDPVTGELLSTVLEIDAHDIAWQPDTQTLLAVDGFGRQCLAFSATLAPSLVLGLRTDYLPLHQHGGRALVAWRDGAHTSVSYDVVGNAAAGDPAVRWARLQVVARADYARTATLLSPIFDGKERDCVWDALYLDACIPPGATVLIGSAVDNDRALLEGPDVSFSDEPPLVLRRQASEIPYYDAYSGQAAQPDRLGTWELLLQRARGRFLRLRIQFAGNGRTSPQVKALRAYYPRFSYSRRYLPAVYQQDAVSASFLERLLATPKEFFSELEGRIGRAGMLVDARGTDPDNLGWLAGWLGLGFDPLWESINQRLGTLVGNPGPVPDRRRLFIRFAPRLFARRGTADGIRFALHLLLEPGLEALLERFRLATLVTDAALAAELAGLGLPALSPTMDDTAIEALLTQYLLSPRRPSKIRLVERFMTRNGRALVAGDASEGSGCVGTATADAHRFAVLVPETLSADIRTMVSRIVQLEKPAHTDFEVRRYWDYFRVGEARLGVDTMLGEDSRFAPVVLGRDTLNGGRLPFPPSMAGRDRWVLDRDPLGAVPGQMNRGTA